MRVEVINTDGLSESVKSKIKSTMKFTKWWEENDTMFCQLENESGDIIRIFPERVKPFHSFSRLVDVAVVSRENRCHDEKVERGFSSIEKIKRIAEDIKSDTEWVNDSHTSAEHQGVKSGLDMLVRHLEETSVEQVEEVSTQDLKEVSTQDLRNELELRGYQTDNLWHIEDVMQNYDCESEVAQEVLIKAMNNEATIGQVYLAIDIVADEVFNLKIKS